MAEQTLSTVGRTNEKENKLKPKSERHKNENCDALYTEELKRRHLICVKGVSVRETANKTGKGETTATNVSYS